MTDKHYPLHPGQTEPIPLYCTIPLEEYERLKKLENIFNEFVQHNKQQGRL